MENKIKGNRKKINIAQIIYRESCYGEIILYLLYLLYIQWIHLRCYFGFFQCFLLSYREIYCVVLKKPMYFIFKSRQDVACLQQVRLGEPF